MQSLVCGKQYMKNGKEWVQCTGCKHRARDQYFPTPGSVPCIYVNCEYNMELCFMREIKPKNQLLNLFQTFKIHYIHTSVYNFQDWMMSLNCCYLFLSYYLLLYSCITSSLQLSMLLQQCKTNSYVL